MGQTSSQDRRTASQKEVTNASASASTPTWEPTHPRYQTKKETSDPKHWYITEDGLATGYSSPSESAAKRHCNRLNNAYLRRTPKQTASPTS